MEEKLNELLEKAELQIIQHEKEREELSNKIRFLKEHGFEKEKEWLLNKKNAMNDVFFDYRETVQNIREMLNKWLS